MRLTIAFITAREEPRLDWLLETLATQTRADDEIRILVVDALWPRPLTNDRALVDTPGVVEIRSVLPKPNLWQGPHRIAPRDMFANANARNTAICYCEDPYIAFLDDRARLEPGWLDVVRRGEATRESVLCGPYDKLESTPDGGTWLSMDHRRKSAPHGARGCGGGWAFGGNFALPLEWLVGPDGVNGCEEGCDPTGQEDCVLGLMLANRGRQIDFVTGMSVQQDRTGFVHPPAFPRLDKGPSPHDRSHAVITRFGTRNRTEFTPDLRTLRTRVLAGDTAPFPIPNPSHDYRDWWDDQLIRETNNHA